MPILELFPYLQATLISKNYQKYFKEIKILTDTIIETLPEKPNAIIGMGDWFFGKNNNNQTIDIMIITNKNYQQYKTGILQQIKSRKTDKIMSKEVIISLHAIKDLNKQIILQDKIYVLFGNFVNE